MYEFLYISGSTQKYGIPPEMGSISGTIWGMWNIRGVGNSTLVVSLQHSLWVHIFIYIPEHTRSFSENMRASTSRVQIWGLVVLNSMKKVLS